MADFTTNSSEIASKRFIDIALPNDQLTTTSNTMEDICGPLTKPYLLAVSIGPCMVAIENLFFLFAVLMYRRKLKHNNVYTYVTSALFANVLTSLWAFYHFLNYYYGIESEKPTFWWAFRKGMTAGFSLILCGNIGLLIYAIEDNTYMLGRLVSGRFTATKSNNKLDRKFRWRKALILITFAWILPVAYGLLAMTPWNCTYDCTCTLYLSSEEPLCKGEKCSRLYTPMAKTYLLVIVLIWLLEISFLLFAICKAAVSFPKWPGARNRVDMARGENNLDNGYPNDSGNNNSERNISNFRRFSPKMAHSYRFPFLLLGLFITCTMPVMILFVLDWAIKDFKAGTIVVNIITPLPLLYCVVSPILLTKRLSGMKSAIRMALSFNWVKGGWNNVSKKRSARSSLGNPPLRGSAVSVTYSEDKANEDFPPTPV